VDQVRDRNSSQLAETDGEHRRPQRMLERLSGAEIRRERKRTHYLGGPNPLPSRTRIRSL